MTAASFALLRHFYTYSLHGWLSAFQKRHYFRSALSRKSHQTRGQESQLRAVIFPFTATAFCADWLSGLPKIRSFPFCSEPQAHQTRGGVTARAVFFPLPPQRFARICCRASRLRLHRERAWRWQPLRNRQCSHRQPDCLSCHILRPPWPHCGKCQP